MDSDSSINLQEKINQFESFLSQFKTKSKTFTYTRLGNSIYTCGSYLIPDGPDNAKFLNDYCELYDLLEQNDSKDFVMNFSEKQIDIGPFMFDLDFNFDSTVINFDKSKIKEYVEHKYTEEDVIRLILFINETFYKYFGLQQSDIICYLQEKPYATIKFDKDGNFKCIKDGFHLCYIYPLTLENRTFIFNHIKNYFTSKRLLDNIGFTNNYDTVFDEASLRNNWMLYGCYKAMDDFPQVYTCKYYYDYNGNKYDVDLTFEELVRVFDVRQYLNYHETLIFNKEEYLKNHVSTEDNIDDILINSIQHRSINKQSIKYEPNKNFNIDDYADLEKMDLNENERKFMYLKGLLNLLSPLRADDYDYWIHICWALVSEGRDNEKIFNLFLEFSQQSNKYSYEACKKLWDKSRDENVAKLKGKSNITIGTLISYAKEDDFINYKKLINLYYHSLQEEIIQNAFDNDIAKYTYYNYGFKHIYSRKTKTWYWFNGNIWDTKNDEGALYKDISENVRNEFTLIQKYEINRRNKELATIIPSQNNSTSDSDMINKINAKLKEKTKEITEKNRERNKLYLKLFRRLSNYPAIEQIIKACTMIDFAIKDIDNIMNSNPYLIGFNNGIFDLNTNTFRLGKPEDYVSLSVNYNYVDYTGNEPIFQDLDNYFNSLFKDKEVREYVLRLLASRLEGQNNNNVHIWTGPASNGKSVFTLLLNKLFGEYYGTLESNVLTKPRNNPEAATPALMSTQNKRIVIVQEPEANEQLNVGLIKQLSGGQDKVMGRKLNQDVISFIPTFELIIICNNIPVLNNVDNGIARRLNVVNFNTVFVKGERPLKNNEARANPNIEQYIKKDKWTSPLMWLLINKWYKEYRKIGLCQPECVRYATQSYISSSDEVREFIKESFVLDKDDTLEHDKKPVKLIELHNEYISWVKNRGYIRKYRTHSKFGDHITQIIGLTIKDGIVEHLYRKKINIIDSESMTY